MARFFSKRADVLGKRPGEMVYIGRKPAKKTQIEKISYNNTELIDKSDIGINDFQGDSQKKNSWINIEGISDVQAMEAVRNELNLNPLIAADIMNTGIRPKFQIFDSGIFITLKMLMYDNDKKIIIAEQLSLVVKDNQLVSFQEAEGDVFGPVRVRLNNVNTRIRTAGVDYLTYCLIDSVVDNYIGIVQNLAEKIEDVEELLLEDPDEEVLKQIIYLKKELLYLSKSIKPAREMIKQIITDKPPLLSDSTEYYVDLYSNLTHVVETLDLYREITTEQQNTYDTYVNNKLNEIMKFLTVFSVIFLPLTLITGIYGTNFDFIPELHLKYGYLMLWGLLIFFALIMILIFKKKKWL